MMPELLVLAAGAAIGGFVQGVSGFAFGMVAMSVWVWTIDPRMAAVMTVFGGFTGQLISAVTVRRRLQLPILLPFLVGGAAGIPLGVLALGHLDPVRFKLVVGAILTLFCPFMLLAPRMPRIVRGGRLGDLAAGVLGGVMGGLGGFTGVAPALWCALRGYERDVYRAVLQNFNLAVLAATLVALALSGAIRREMLPGFAVVAPALVLPSLLGSRVYLGLSPVAFRRIVLGLLSLSGLAMIGASLSTIVRH